MSSSESVEENSLVLVHDFFSGNDTSHWESITHTFGHSDDIRLETCPSVSPELLSDSTETGLDFVSNYNTAVFSYNLSDSWTVTLWNRVDSSDTLDWFEDQACNFSVNGI